MAGERQFDHEASTAELPNFDLHIKELAKGIPEDVVSEKAITLASGMLNMLQKTYGNPESPDYKPYHNAQHSLNVLRRSWKLWGLLQDQLPEKFDDQGYEMLLFASAGHDLFVSQNAQTGEDEKQSAHFTRTFMRQGGYSEEEAYRVYCAIEASAVERDDEGTIVQTNIRKGSEDPLKLIFATADINGIAMEGAPTMLEDAMNLYMEFSGTSKKDIMKNPKGAVDFMLTQSKFLEDRLSERDKDLEYYFDEDEFNIVDKIYKREFSSATREALILARRMYDFPGLAKGKVGEILEHTNKSARNVSSLPKKIGRTIVNSHNSDS